MGRWKAVIGPQLKAHSFENQKTEGRCCKTLTVDDSHGESMRLHGVYDKALTRPISHNELAQLQCRAAQTWFPANMGGQGDGLARAA